jgi:hypothetical protein
MLQSSDVIEELRQTSIIKQVQKLRVKSKLDCDYSMKKLAHQYIKMYQDVSKDDIAG